MHFAKTLLQDEHIKFLDEMSNDQNLAFNYFKELLKRHRPKISFRNNNNDTNVTTLIFQPYAKAVAGKDGAAIATPLSRAIIKKESNVDIIFEPKAIAIAGPGGIAHAQSDLEITYYYSADDIQSSITLIPFYGGGKGQSLQIVERPDGTVLTSIVQTPVSNKPLPNEEINTSELENPPLPTKHELTFGSNIRNIHRTAINIIKLQELAKKNGKLDPNQENLYQQNMDELNDSARNLAQIQEAQGDYSFENREGLNEWFERKKAIKKDKESKKKEEEEQSKKKKEENKKPVKEEEEEENGDNEGSDVISIGLPPEDASVAEAKPVGLAVAGVGGVAASKPIATAVVGPGGLAIARPVGTAIAGVAPDQALVPIYAEGYIAGSKPKKQSTHGSKADATSDLLNRIISKYHQV